MHKVQFSAVVVLSPAGALAAGSPLLKLISIMGCGPGPSIGRNCHEILYNLIKRTFET